MKISSSKKNKSILDFLFFSGLVMLSISLLITIVTLKNECIYLQNEIYHLESIQSTHASRIGVLNGSVNNLSRQDRIEEIASDSFNLQIPAPESLIVYLGVFYD